MDYGKLAYLKTQDLENRLARFASESPSCASLSRECGVYLSDESTIAYLEASGSLTLTVAARVKSEDAFAARLGLKINGMVADECSLELNPNEERDVILLAAARVDGSATLKLYSDHRILLLSARISAIGEGVRLSAGGESAAADLYNGKCALVYAQKGSIFGALTTESDFALNPVYLASGVSADITAAENGFAVAYSDEYKNSFFLLTDQNLSPQVRVVVGESADSVALARFNKGFIYAEIIGESLYCRYVSPEGGASTAVEVAKNVKSAAFVKNQTMPSLLVFDGKVSRLINLSPEYGSADLVSVSAALTINGV